MKQPSMIGAKDIKEIRKAAQEIQQLRKSIHQDTIKLMRLTEAYQWVGNADVKFCSDKDRENYLALEKIFTSQP